MRDLALASGILLFLGMTFRYPFAGVLTWVWLTIMNPHMMVYGFALALPFNFAVAIVTVGAWLLSRDKRAGWQLDALPWLMFALVLWMTVNSFFAVAPDWSWPLWQRTVKIYALAFLCLFMVNSKARLHAMICVMVMSICYFGVKGGIFVILTGGVYHVLGPDNTIIRDNNQLALAIVMTVPLTYYLYLQTRHKWLRLALALAIPMEVASVLGSYSRGGVIALAAVLGLFWLRSRRKVLHMLVVAIAVGGALQLMPAKFFDRVDSIQNASADDSFVGRLNAWKVAYEYASDHFPFGAGYAGPQLPQVFNYYVPDEPTHAAHSIYFQVLGEHGFIALGLYLLIAFLSLRNTRIVVKRCRARPELAWAGDLAAMMEISLVGFYIGGAALSMAYYDGLLLLQVFTSILRAMTAKAPSRVRTEAAAPLSAPHHVTVSPG